MLKSVSLIFIVLIAFAVGIDEEANPCPEHWIRATFVDMGCLYFNRTAEVTWDDANKICQNIENQNATLVEILTEDQMDFLAMELDAIGEAGNIRYWTGGTDKGREGQWFWISSLKEMGDFVWASGHISSGTDWNCVGLHSSLHYLGDDYVCSSSSFYPICQIYV